MHNLFSLTKTRALKSSDPDVKETAYFFVATEVHSRGRISVLFKLIVILNLDIVTRENILIALSLLI